MPNTCPNCGHELQRNHGSAFDLKLSSGESSEAMLYSILRLSGDKIEVKDDEKCSKTGNIAVEFAQSDGRGGEKPSGIQVTKSDWWATRIGTFAWLLVPTESMRRAAELKRRKQGLIKMGDNGNKGVLIRLNGFIDWLRSGRL